MPRLTILSSKRRWSGESADFGERDVQGFPELGTDAFPPEHWPPTPYGSSKCRHHISFATLEPNELYRRYRNTHRPGLCKLLDLSNEELPDGLVLYELLRDANGGLIAVVSWTSDEAREICHGHSTYYTETYASLSLTEKIYTDLCALLEKCKKEKWVESL